MNEGDVVVINDLAGMARSRRLNKIARGTAAKSYMEVGVFRGKTFVEVNVEEKHAIDPKFKFDFKSIESDRVVFHEVTSDVFFSSLAIEKKFDLIYLDGLHTFEQTYRDICNSLVHSGDRSVILVDDTVPNDVFSAMPVQKDCLRLRAKSGLTAKAWHGDVYKAIFALNVFHPALKYRTIVGSGNPQTLIWRANDVFARRGGLSFEEISRLDYLSFLRNFSLMHPANEDEALEICFSDLRF